MSPVERRCYGLKSMTAQTPTPGAAPPAPTAPDEALGATLRRTIPALDGLRGVAILSVVAHQLCIDGYPSHRLIRLALWPCQSGWVGVQLFFVLSGFLITGILLDTRSAENYWSSFFARRVLRIFPLYYALLVGTFVIAPRLLDLPAAALDQHRHQAWYWLYVANWRFFGGGAVDSLGHCWSLAVEEQFYLLWPVAVRLLGGRGLVRLCVVVVVGSLLLRLGLRLGGASPDLVYELLPCRADALALGALAAIAVRRAGWLSVIEPRLGRLAAATFALLAAVAVASGGLVRTHVVTQTIGYTVVAVASAVVIVGATLATARGGGRFAALSSPILRSYGRYSYGIYVWHLPLHLFVTRKLIAPRLAGLSQPGFAGLQLGYLVAGALGLLAVGHLSYRVVEKPFLDRKRLFASRPASAAVRGHAERDPIQ
jgi:peptidoglycan/LPS O-acetylase OafA/YrhL